MEDPRDVIIRPVVSEKSYALSEKGVYIFVVARSTNKIEIRRSVEHVFNVKVTNVNTLNRPGKRKRNRKKATYGKQPDTKRAIVTLAAGQTMTGAKRFLLGSVPNKVSHRARCNVLIVSTDEVS